MPVAVPSPSLNTAKGMLTASRLAQLQRQEGHKISLSVNGTPLKETNISTQLILREVPRGSHTLQATIVDGEMKPLISTPVVNFHMRKAALPKTEP